MDPRRLDTIIDAACADDLWVTRDEWHQVAHQLAQDDPAAPNRSRKAPTPASARLRGCR